MKINLKKQEEYLSEKKRGSQLKADAAANFRTFKYKTIMSENIIKYGNTGISKIANEYKAIKVRNEDDVFNYKNKSLILMTPEIGAMGVKALLSYAISDLVDFFNLGKTMTVEQIAQTVEMIIDEFGMLKIDDFKLCFSREQKRILWSNI